jgi:hypothetical protein
MQNPIKSWSTATTIAFLTLGLAVVAEGATVLWWASLQNARLAVAEARLADLQNTAPLNSRQIIDVDRRIAVIDERIAKILGRLEALTAALERLHQSR